MTAVEWWGYGIATAVLVILLGGMFVLVKFMSDESGKYEDLKAMLDPLFHTPAFLRPGNDSQDEKAKAEAAAARPMVEPFEEECPACGERVTHEHEECPSCGLRLMNG